MVKYKLPEGFKIERNPNIEHTWWFYKIPNVLNKSASYTSLISLVKDCIEYNKRLETLEKVKPLLKSGFSIEVPIDDPVNYLFYGRERIASSGIIEELVLIADKAEVNFELVNRLNNGEEIEINE